MMCCTLSTVILVGFQNVSPGSPTYCADNGATVSKIVENQYNFLPFKACSGTTGSTKGGPNISLAQKNC